MTMAGLVFRQWCSHWRHCISVRGLVGRLYHGSISDCESLSSILSRRRDFETGAALQRHITRCEAGQKFLLRKAPKSEPEPREQKYQIPTMSKYDVKRIYDSRDATTTNGACITVVTQSRAVQNDDDRSARASLCSKKRLLGNRAVDRVRARRRLRPIIYKLLPDYETKGVDYVFCPGPGSLFISSDDLVADIHQTLHRTDLYATGDDCRHCRRLQEVPFYLRPRVFPEYLLRNIRSALISEYAISLFSGAISRRMGLLLLQEMQNLLHKAALDPALRKAIDLRHHDQQRVHVHKKLLWQSSFQSRLIRDFIGYTIRRGHLTLLDEIVPLYSFLVEEAERHNLIVDNSAVR